MKPQTPEEIFTLQNPQDGKLPHWAKMLTEEHTRQALLYALEDAANNGEVDDYSGAKAFIKKSSILSRYESICNDLGLLPTKQ